MIAALLGGSRVADAPLAPSDAAWHACGFEQGRDGLAAWLRALRATPGARVVVSAQICVAVRVAIQAAGLAPVYVDLDDRHPTPSARQFAEALGPNVAAVIVAPFYGYIQADWQPLLEALGPTPLCLDLAQGLGLESQLAPLVARADAVLYSFSVGKGLDLGGAVVFTRQPLATPDRPAPAVRAGAVLSSLAIRALVALGLYRFALPAIERRIDEDPEAAAPSSTAAFTVASVAGYWGARAAAYRAEVQRSRACAVRLAALPAVVAGCRDLDVYGDSSATHLRQVIRLRHAPSRAATVAALRRAGIDCAPAGEPLPPAADGQYPNAAQFRADAIRLPFLGRLTAAQQGRVERGLEMSLA